MTELGLDLRTHHHLNSMLAKLRVVIAPVVARSLVVSGPPIAHGCLNIVAEAWKGFSKEPEIDDFGLGLPDRGTTGQSIECDRGDLDRSPRGQTRELDDTES